MYVYTHIYVCLHYVSQMRLILNGDKEPLREQLSTSCRVESAPAVSYTQSAPATAYSIHQLPHTVCTSCRIQPVPATAYIMHQLPYTVCTSCRAHSLHQLRRTHSLYSSHMHAPAVSHTQSAPAAAYSL